MNDNVNACRHACSGGCRWIPVVIGACLCIVAATAGLLALSSCATKPSELPRADAQISAWSNAIVAIRSTTPYIAQPAGGLVEALLAVATAGLAAWSAHLHSSVRTRKNAKASPPARPSG